MYLFMCTHFTEKKSPTKEFDTIVIPKCSLWQKTLTKLQLQNLLALNK